MGTLGRLRVTPDSVFARAWNELLEETQRRTPHVVPPLLIHEDQGGFTVAMPKPKNGFGFDAFRLVKITSNAAGGGWYNGRICTGSMTIPDGTANLGLPEDCVVPDADNCVIFNAEEDGQGTHWLKVDSFAIGEITGSVEGSGDPLSDPPVSPLAIIGIPSGTPRIASPQALGLSSEGSETADTHTWTRTATTSGVNYGDIPVEVWQTCRVVYNDTGDKVLYAMARKFTYAADGKLNSISAETRVSVDAAGTCP